MMLKNINEGEPIEIALSWNGNVTRHEGFHVPVLRYSQWLTLDTAAFDSYYPEHTSEGRITKNPKGKFTIKELITITPGTTLFCNEELSFKKSSSLQ